MAFLHSLGTKAISSHFGLEFLNVLKKKYREVSFNRFARIKNCVT